MLVQHHSDCYIQGSRTCSIWGSTCGREPCHPTISTRSGKTRGQDAHAGGIDQGVIDRSRCPDRGRDPRRGPQGHRHLRPGGRSSCIGSLECINEWVTGRDRRNATGTARNGLKQQAVSPKRFLALPASPGQWSQGLFRSCSERWVSVHKVEFMPVGRRDSAQGITLLECARRLDVDLVGIAAASGCAIAAGPGGGGSPFLSRRPRTGRPFREEEIGQGRRLACMTVPQGDIRVHVPPESLSAPQRTQVEGLEVRVDPDPLVRGFEVRMTAPSLGRPLPDDRNLWDVLRRDHGLAPGTIDLAVQQVLASRLRELRFEASVVVREGEIIALDAPATRWIGLAVDIGTTKIAVYLVDMKSGDIIASAG